MDSAERPVTFETYLSRDSFFTPAFRPESAWIDHGPFAFWLIQALRPRTLVELGTHGGYSYFVFCQAIKSLNLDTRCFAVDTWQGDEHAGFYSEDFFNRVSDHNAAHYGSFSRLVRATFDAALAHFSDGAIDLLHIDGRHFYEDVKHDFEAWKPKLSDRAVVLFHDTNVRERDFGVFRLWKAFGTLTHLSNFSTATVWAYSPMARRRHGRLWILSPRAAIPRPPRMHAWRMDVWERRSETKPSPRRGSLC